MTKWELACIIFLLAGFGLACATFVRSPDLMGWLIAQYYIGLIFYMAIRWKPIVKKWAVGFIQENNDGTNFTGRMLAETPHTSTLNKGLWDDMEKFIHNQAPDSKQVIVLSITYLGKCAVSD